jgi:hypothetical protein
LQQLIQLFKIPRTRNILPEKKIVVEKINEQSAAQSDYAGCFKDQGFINDRGKLVFW